MLYVKRDTLRKDLKLFGNSDIIDITSYIIMQKVATLQIYYAKRPEMHFVVVTPQRRDGSLKLRIWFGYQD